MKYKVLDIETNGLDYKKNEITEIAGCTVNKGEVTQTFSTICKIEGEVTKFIEDLTGITKTVTELGSSFEHSFVNFMESLEISKSDTIVIHNVKFDYNFILHHAQKYPLCKPYLDIFSTCKKICSLEYARKILPNESCHKLDYLKEKFGIGGKSHRALPDVLVTNKVFIELMKIEKQGGIKL